MDEGDTFVKEDLSVIDKRKSILERNLDKVTGPGHLVAITCLGSHIKCNLLLESNPDGILFRQLIIVHAAFLSEHLEYVTNHFLSSSFLQ